MTDREPLRATVTGRELLRAIAADLSEHAAFMRLRFIETSEGCWISGFWRWRHHRRRGESVTIVIEDGQLALLLDDTIHRWPLGDPHALDALVAVLRALLLS